MDLFEPLIKKIKLPEYAISSIKIDNNSVQRYINKSIVVEVTITDSTHNGLYELTTDIDQPFDLIYLKKWNTRSNIPEDVPCIKFKCKGDLETLDESTQLLWETPPYENIDLLPIDIVDSWSGKFQFRQDLPDSNQEGLRKPQLGALHAISAYFATDKLVDPATVVLPTGTGKTETMLATLIYQQCEKLLVVVPSNSLREQIANKFLTLGCLPELSVVPNGCFLPYVVKLKKGIQTVEEANSLIDATNIIVATASILRSSNQQAVDALCEHCSHLFVDEAHHISARSWESIRDRFAGRKVVQFTATPFRNDGNSLGGKIIYNYTMGEAQRAGYFKQVNLRAIEEYYDVLADQAIADEAVSALRQDIENEFDHLMMVRVNSKDRANSILEVYKKSAADLNPIVVHSGYTQSKNNSCLAELMSRRSRIVICVDMLGEGYDLPNLKIAAIHDHHKSLAVTLQFIGRFIRTANDKSLGDASVIVNIADPGVENDLQHLYAQGADWDEVLRRLSENRIDREIELQEMVDALKEKGDLCNQISLWNLKPSYSAMLFKTQCVQWTPEKFKEALPNFDKYWYSMANDKNILIILAIQNTAVKWGNYKDLHDSNYKLLIANWDEERNALFMFSNDYKSFRVETMADTLCEDKCQVMTGAQIFNIFNGIEYPLVRNLGASQVGAISFTQYFGPNVTDGLSLIERSQSNLSNIAGLGYEDGEKVIWGCSQRKGKIWSPRKGGSVSGWSDWVRSAWDKIVDGNSNNSNITRDFLRPIKISINHDQHPVAAQWGEQLQSTYEDKVFIVFGDEEIPIYLVDLMIVGTDDEGCVKLEISSEGHRSIYKITIDGELAKGYEYSLIEGETISVRKGQGEIKAFDEMMMLDPIFINYVDGSFSYNCYLVTVPDSIGLFLQEDIVADEWGGVDIKKESMGYDSDPESIQYHVFKSIINDYEIIINDDGSGEAADLVALKIVDKEIVLNLIHCKYSSKETPGARLKDLYEVCGQAQRSIRWKHAGIPYLYKHVKHRESLWHDRGYSRFLKGSIADLANYKNISRTSPVRLEVSIVQPGLSKAGVNEEMLKLLGSTALYIKKTTMAELGVYAAT